MGANASSFGWMRMKTMLNAFASGVRNTDPETLELNIPAF
jgi:hypothetical protein